MRFWPGGYTLDQILSNGQTVLLPEKEIVEQSQCYVVHLKSIGEPNEHVGYKIWLDPEQGFLPRKIEIWSSGQVRAVIGPITLQRFGEGIWFPVRAEFTSYLTSGESKRYSIEIEQIRINEGLDESIFIPVFESGMTVYDEQLGSSYVVPQP